MPLAIHLFLEAVLFFFSFFLFSFFFSFSFIPFVFFSLHWLLRSDYSQATDWHPASVPGEQSITTDRLGYGRHFNETNNFSSSTQKEKKQKKKFNSSHLSWKLSFFFTLEKERLLIYCGVRNSLFQQQKKRLPKWMVVTLHRRLLVCHRCSASFSLIGGNYYYFVCFF